MVPPPTPSTCDHVAVTCMDFRIVPHVFRLFEHGGLVGDVDLLAWPGGAAGLTIEEEADRLLDAFALARRLHGCERALLVVHEDCLRLGGSAAHEGPAAEVDALEGYLRAAAARLRERLPELESRLVRIGLDGAAAEIES